MRSPEPKPHPAALRLGWLPTLSTVLLVSGCFGPHLAPVAEESSRAVRPGVIDASRTFQIVAAGDTLYSIAFAAGLDYRQVADWNGITAPYVIRPGQRIELRPLNTAAPSTAPSTEPPATDRPSARQPDATTPAAGEGSVTAWVWPAKGKIVQRFADAQGNKGIDIAAPAGSAVRAAAAGHVVYAGSGLRGYGQLIIVKHNDSFLSAYAHNRRMLVREGDRVSAGQQIAEMGNSGGGAVRLHFEIRRRGSPVDPLRYLPTT